MTNILVVDDDRSWFARCEEAVSGMGFVVRLATTGVDVFAKIEDQTPDLVFLGMESDSAGPHLLWLLEDLLPGVPVVVCSSEGDLTGSRAFGPNTDLKATAFLHKFAGAAEIVGTTARVLGQSRGLLDRGELPGSTVH
jgi:DNA-binding NtrC family response regulator